MANVIIDETHFYDIADAIRDKLSVETTYKPREMAAAIESIPTGVEKPEMTFDVTPTTQDQTVTPTTGYVFSSGTVRAMPSGAQGDITLTKTISGNIATVAASQTDIMGYIIGITKTANTSISASELVSGTISITDTNLVDVTNNQHAQIVDENLSVENIKYGVEVLGLTGTADTVTTVSEVPTTKYTSIVYNSTDGKYYIWRD